MTEPQTLEELLRSMLAQDRLERELAEKEKWPKTRTERVCGGFVCPELGCGKRYRKQKALKRHVDIRHG